MDAVLERVLAKKKTYGELLRELRDKAKLSRRQMSEKCGVKFETICNHEYDEAGIPSATLFAYCQVLGVECSAFKDCKLDIKKRTRSKKS